jgi:fucose 4-O-acetylase-like acetyltransferase
MRSTNPNSLLDRLLVYVPAFAIAVWTWGWRTLAVMLLGTIVVRLLIEALEGDSNSKNHVFAFLSQAGLMRIAAVGLVVAGVVALTLATVVGEPRTFPGPLSLFQTPLVPFPLKQRH